MVALHVACSMPRHVNPHLHVSVAEERCAGILKSTEVEKWFSPPPRSLRAESELYKCLWVMKGLKDKMIRLQFRDLSVDYHEFCKLSRIQVS